MGEVAEEATSSPTTEEEDRIVTWQEEGGTEGGGEGALDLAQDLESVRMVAIGNATGMVLRETGEDRTTGKRRAQIMWRKWRKWRRI
jgi:hypothetical protein